MEILLSRGRREDFLRRRVGGRCGGSRLAARRAALLSHSKKSSGGCTRRDRVQLRGPRRARRDHRLRDGPRRRAHRSLPLPLTFKEIFSSLSLLFSSFLARTLLEAPAAVLLGRRGWQVLHAGAVVGPRGAAVVRGPSGAGKSTLVAAAHRAGLGVLGDESVFVSRRDPDDLAASVRDLALREDSARLLGIFDSTESAFTGREVKRRVDLFNGSAPCDRRARRAAAVLLGPREPGPARLAPLSGRCVSRRVSRGRDPAGAARRPRCRRPRVGGGRMAPLGRVGSRRRRAIC